MKHKIEKELWSCDNLNCSLDDFVALIHELAEEHGSGEIIIRSESDYDTGNCFNVVHIREETDEEYKSRTEKEKLDAKQVKKLKESAEYKTYLKLRKQFEGLRRYIKCKE